ncbi:MAG TPA: hypothetical protein PK225_15490, partial [Azonexus sp.]|nr:hypothetical protein [Azonexus sp.]
MAESKEYRAWLNMKCRCYNRLSTGYQMYGGRGIKVCAKWRFSFDAFYADVGPAPSPKHSIDRIDTNGSYRPGNVRWATRSVQNKNTRRSRDPKPIHEVMA